MKRKLLAVIMSALCFAAALPASTVLADGQKVVTLGADLSEEQKQMMLRYFGIAGQNIQTLTITNADEREHLGSYVPIEQIGTRAISCALVSPTTSGGIQVKTANLTWVTSNMIASTLSTSGVVNCDVLAAAPFEVSGTGALTGIIMAYESAAGTTLDEEKKDTATQELVTTTTIANNIGQLEATQIVNETKTQVIENNTTSNVTTNDIDVIINEVAEENNVSLTDEDRQLLADLLERISGQDYNYEEMSETLQRVEENLEQLQQESEAAEAGIDDSGVLILDEDLAQTEAMSDQTEAPAETAETLASDSILLNTDDSALGENVFFDATDQEALAETEAPAAEQTEAAADTGADVSGEFEVTQEDVYTDGSDAADGSEAVTDGSDAVNGNEVILDDSAEITDGSETADGAGLTDDASVSSDFSVITLADLVLEPRTTEEENTVFDAGSNYLTVKSSLVNLTGGSGTLSLYDADLDMLLETITMNDMTKVTAEAMSPEALAEQGWTEGSEIRIYLSQPLSQYTTYRVVLSDDAIRTQEGTASYVAAEDAGDWSFTTGGFGIALTETASGLTAGSTVTGNLYMDTELSAYAVIDAIYLDSAEAADLPAAVDTTEFWGNGSFQATLNTSGTIAFHVSYYDSQDTMSLVQEVTYLVEVK